MNADPATTSPHLSLDDLTAEANGQVISDRARKHLAACGHCRAEASRWSLVAGGVRSLVTATPPVPQPVLAGRPHVSAGRWRRSTLAASAAAALVLAGGASYGVNAALRQAPARNGSTTAALTSVNGCHDLRQADGTLEKVKGSKLTIKTASGQKVVVTTTASTVVSLLGLPLSYLASGMKVMVDGPRSDGTITARHVNVRPGLPRKGMLVEPPGYVAVRGTARHVSAAGFILVTTGGTRIPVLTSARTQVGITPPDATISDLRTGVATISVGKLGPHGRLSAMGVLQQPESRGMITVRGCTPSSIDDAITTAFAAGG